jgi:hypothetical protein
MEAQILGRRNAPALTPPPLFINVDDTHGTALLKGSLSSGGVGVKVCRPEFLGTQGGRMQVCTRSTYNALPTLFAFRANDLATFSLLWIVFRPSRRLPISLGAAGPKPGPARPPASSPSPRTSTAQD